MSKNKQQNINPSDIIGRTYTKRPVSFIKQSFIKHWRTKQQWLASGLRTQWHKCSEQWLSYSKGLLNQSGNRKCQSYWPRVWPTETGHNLPIQMTKRKLVSATVGSLMFCASMAGAVHAATIIVDVNTITGDAAGDCDLEDAIKAADDDIAVDNCIAGSGDDTIIFATSPDTIVLTEPSIVSPGNDENGLIEGAGDNGLPIINSTITLDGGSGITITRNSADEFRIIEMYQGNLSLDNVTIHNGDAGRGGGGGILAHDSLITLTASSIVSNSAYLGGGIIVGNGSVTVVDSNITANTAGGWGGGIFVNLNSGGTSITVVDSVITANTAKSGGGIQAMSDTLITVVNSEIAYNRASVLGGGINAANNSPTTITDSQIHNNYAGFGGGIYIGNDSTLTVQSSTIAENIAQFLHGGGILASKSIINISDSQLLDNSAASGDGGALYYSGGQSQSVVIQNSCIVGNTDNAVHGGFGSPMIDAQSNWWGAADGPGFVALGSGDTVNNRVDTANFLTAPPAACESSGQVIDVSGNGTASAAAIVVDVDTITGEAAGDCDLADAIMAANDDAAVDNCIAGSGDDTIQFATGIDAITLTDPSTDTTAQNSSGLPVITSVIAIDGGSGVTITRNSAAKFPILNIYRGDLSLDNMTIHNGYAKVGYSDGNGGGISLVESNLALTDSSIISNTAGQFGGGIFVNSSAFAGSSITLINSAITANTAESGGGILTMGDTPITVESSEIAYNRATAFGGGILAPNDSPTTITDSKIHNNYAAGGGGGVIVENDSTLIVRRSIIAENIAQNLHGGGIVVRKSAANIIDSQLLANSAANGEGGALYNVGDYSQNITIHNSCIVGNTDDAVHGGFGSLIIDAQSNWWGAADGPGLVAAGSGDTVNDRIDTANFLTAPPAVCTSSGPAIEMLEGDTNFGNVPMGASATQTFKINNVGTDTVYLTLPIIVGGANPGDFVVTTPPAATIPGGGSTTFQVTFTPSGGGLRSATIEIAYNDSSGNPYNFGIQGRRSATIEISNDESDENSYTFAIQGNGVAASQPIATPTATFTPFPTATSTPTPTPTPSAIVSLSPSFMTTVENAGTISLYVILNRVLDVPVDVTLGSVIQMPDYATAAIDYNIDQVVTFLPGETVKEVTVTINQDALTEPNEQFRIVINGISGGGVAAGSMAESLITILDDDSPTATPTITDTPTATATPTATDTPMATATPIATATPLPTDTPMATATPTATGTPQPTATLVPTVAPTNTLLPTSTALSTATPTDVALPTNTPLSTATTIPTAIPTMTNTPLPTSTDVPTPTDVPTATATVAATVTATATEVPTDTPVPPTATATEIVTEIAAATEIPTDTPVPSTATPVLPTATSVSTATDVPTGTPTPSATPVPPTATSVSTATGIPTATDVPTDTPTPSATPVPPTATDIPMLPTATSIPATATSTPVSPTATPSVQSIATPFVPVNGLKLLFEEDYELIPDAIVSLSVELGDIKIGALAFEYIIFNCTPPDWFFSSFPSLYLADGTPLFFDLPTGVSAANVGPEERVPCTAESAQCALAFNELDAETQADLIENGINVEIQLSADVEMGKDLSIGVTLADENFNALSSTDSGLSQTEVNAKLTVGIPLSEQGVAFEPAQLAVPTSITPTEEPINRIFLPLISR